jgi:hypothetical protein
VYLTSNDYTRLKINADFSDDESSDNIDDYEGVFLPDGLSIVIKEDGAYL